MFGDLSEIKKVQQDVETAIDNGASTVEQYHREFANTALETVGQYVPLGDAGQQIKDFQDGMITGFYDLVRNTNRSAGELTRNVLSQVGGGGSSTPPSSSGTS